MLEDLHAALVDACGFLPWIGSSAFSFAPRFCWVRHLKIVFFEKTGLRERGHACHVAANKSVVKLAADWTASRGESTWLAGQFIFLLSENSQLLFVSVVASPLDDDHLMEIASLTQEKEELRLSLEEEKKKVQAIRSQLWREQNLRNASEGRARDLAERLADVKGLMEANLDLFLQHPDLLSALKAKVKRQEAKSRIMC